MPSLRWLWCLWCLWCLYGGLLVALVAATLLSQNRSDSCSAQVADEKEEQVSTSTVIIHDCRFSNKYGVYKYKVQRGSRVLWQIEDDVEDNVLEEFKARRPDLWDAHDCSICSHTAFTTGPTDYVVEGWMTCTRCSSAVCLDCAENYPSGRPLLWRRCYYDRCGSGYCPEHAERITTPNKWHGEWFCCVPFEVQASCTGVREEEDGWGVILEPNDFATWEAGGWKDEVHPSGLDLAQVWPYPSLSDPPQPTDMQQDSVAARSVAPSCRTESKMDEEEYAELRRHYLEPYQEHDPPSLSGTSGATLRHRRKRCARIESESPGFKALRKLIKALDRAGDHTEVYRLLRALCEWEERMIARGMPLPPALRTAMALRGESSVGAATVMVDLTDEQEPIDVDKYIVEVLVGKRADHKEEMKV